MRSSTLIIFALLFCALVVSGKRHKKSSKHKKIVVSSAHALQMGGEIKAILNDETKFNEVARAGFDSTDTDKSGQIGVAELRAAMEQISAELGLDGPSQDEVNQVFQALDTDKSGKISFDEFKVFIRNLLMTMAESSA